MDTTAMLETCVSSPAINATLLFNLAYLEKTGHQKLLLFKKRHNVRDAEFLGHIADEARHAQMLKTSSLSLNQGSAKINSSTRQYLNKLEVKTLRMIRRAGFNEDRLMYPLLTYLVEKRAEQFYPIYEKLLQNKNVKITLESIIEDELDHLLKVKQKLDELQIPEEILAECSDYESQLFSIFLNDIINSFSLDAQSSN